MKGILTIVPLATICVSAAFIFNSAQAQTPAVGFKFDGYGLNRATKILTEYTGECPGIGISELEARFTSSVNLPKPGQRVIIRNVTAGVDGSKPPYTDREYDRGRSSEATSMTFSGSHDKQFFGVLPGLNTFKFYIVTGRKKRDYRVVAHGIFDAVIDPQWVTRQRNAIWNSETFCIETGSKIQGKDAIQNCANPGIRDAGYCPDDEQPRLTRNARPLNQSNGDVYIITPRY